MERSLGITLYTIAEGEAYAPFAPRWWAAVEKMDPQPAEIVVVIGAEDRCGIRELTAGADRVRIIELDQPFSNTYFTTGCEAGTQEWVGFCGIDDQMLPNAYADLLDATEAGADILVGSIILSSGGIWRGTWDPTALERHNTLPAHSPFRRSLYDAVGGFPDIHWSDWGFWLRCAAHGAKPFYAREPLAIFDVGDSHETMSGVNLDPYTRRNADEELQAFRRSL